MQDIDFGRQQASIHCAAYAHYITGPNGAFPLRELKLLGAVQQSSGRHRAAHRWSVHDQRQLDAAAFRSRGAQTFIARSLHENCPPLKACIGEIIRYSRALASSERTRVEAYLKQKWGCCG